MPELLLSLFSLLFSFVSLRSIESYDNKVHSEVLSIVAIFFFVTMHEFAHSLVARRFGVKVKDITLYPIGGVASMSSMPQKPYQEFLISLAGPLCHFAVRVFLAWVAAAFPARVQP